MAAAALYAVGYMSLGHMASIASEMLAFGSAALLRLGLVASFRTLEGRFVLPFRNVVYRGASAAMLLWLACFMFIVLAVLALGVVAKLPQPLWQHKIGVAPNEKPAASPSLKSTP